MIAVDGSGADEEAARRGHPLAAPVVVLAVLGGLALAILFAAYTVDDAYIVARVADNLVAGNGYGMNPGVRADAVTGPAWLIPWVLAAALGLDGLLVAKAVGLTCSLVAVVVVGWRLHAGGASAGAMALYAVAVAVQGNYALWAVAGLETGLAAMLVALLAALIGGRPPDDPMATPAGVPGYRGSGAGGADGAPRRGGDMALWVARSMAAAMVPWVRPELLPMAACLVLAGMPRSRSSARLGDDPGDPAPSFAAADRFGILAPAAAMLLGGLTVAAFRLIAFGTPWPLSVAAKPASLAQGATYVGLTVLVTTGGAGVGVVLAWWRLSRRVGVGHAGRLPIGIWLLALLVHAGALVIAGGDWMPGFRLWVPALPIYAAVLAIAVSDLLRTRRRMGRLLAAMGCAVALLVPTVDICVQLPRARAAARVRVSMGPVLVAYLRQKGGSVALIDVGYLGWASGLEVVDLGGVTDRAIADRPGDHLAKEIDPGYLQARDPDLLVLHSRTPPAIDEDGRLQSLAGFPVERALARRPWLQSRYRAERVFPWGADHYYVVLHRRL